VVKKFVIDEEWAERQGELQCSFKECAGQLGCSVDFLHAHDEFIKPYLHGRAMGLQRLRETQWKMAEKSATMAIWLGKQYLDQREVMEQVVGEKTSENITNILNQLKEITVPGVDDAPDAQ
jgi:hypothetical protein